MASLVQVTPHVEPRKKVKTSDLPLSSATRGAIDGLAHNFKKKGGYDTLREQVWRKFEAKSYDTNFTKSILEVAEAELEKNTSLLRSDRNKAAALIEGAVDRTQVYQSAENQINEIIDEHIAEIVAGIREFRSNDVGEEVASAEESKGSKTDEQYVAETAAKQAERKKIREDLKAKELAILEEKKKLEKAKRREEERKREAEELKLKEERDRRRAERDAAKDRERERDHERSRERSKYYHRNRDDINDKERDRKSGRDMDHNDDGRKRSVPVPKLSEEDVEAIEKEALLKLVNEGKRISQKPRHQLEPEIDQSLAPPPRKTIPASAIKPISRDTNHKSSDPSRTTEDLSRAVPDSTGRSAEGVRSRSSDRKRSRSRERKRNSREGEEDRGRSARDQSRTRRTSRDRSVVDASSRRDSRDHHERRRDDSRERRRDHSRERSDRRGSDYRESHRRRSRSRSPRRSRERSDRDFRSRARTPPQRPFKTAEELKQEGVRQRELEAKAYLAAQEEARAKNLPVPGWEKPRQVVTAGGFVKPVWDSFKPTSSSASQKDDGIDRSSPVSFRHRDRSREHTRDRETASRARSRSRDSRSGRGSRIERSTSPINIDREVETGTMKEESRSGIVKTIVNTDRLDTDTTAPMTEKASKSAAKDHDHDHDPGHDHDLAVVVVDETAAQVVVEIGRERGTGVEVEVGVVLGIVSVRKEAVRGAGIVIGGPTRELDRGRGPEATIMRSTENETKNTTETEQVAGTETVIMRRTEGVTTEGIETNRKRDNSKVLTRILITPALTRYVFEYGTSVIIPSVRSVFITTFATFWFECTLFPYNSDTNKR